MRDIQWWFVYVNEGVRVWVSEWTYVNEISTCQLRYTIVSGWLSEQGHGTEYEDGLKSDSMNSSPSECERLSEWEFLGEWVSHKLSEFAAVETKSTNCMLPKIHNDQWCIHTVNYQVACCITALSVNSMYGYSSVDFMTGLSYTSYDAWFCWLYVYIISNLVNFYLENDYAFEWYSCRLFWNRFKIPSKWHALFRLSI